MNHDNNHESVHNSCMCIITGLNVFEVPKECDFPQVWKQINWERKSKKRASGFEDNHELSYHECEYKSNEYHDLTSAPSMT